MQRAKSCCSLPLPGPQPCYRLSSEKLNKIPQKRAREGGTGCRSQIRRRQSSRLPGSRLQSICSSQQGQILSLKVRAAPAWQAVPSQRRLGLPRAQPRTQLCSGSVCSGCIEAAGGSAEPSRVLPLLPGWLPQQGNVLPPPSPAPCSYAQENNCSRARRGVNSHPQNPSHASHAQWGAPYSITHQHKSWLGFCTSSAPDMAGAPPWPPRSCPQQYPTCSLHSPLPRALTPGHLWSISQQGRSWGPGTVCRMKDAG